jgi:hypothetical protein
VNDRDVAEEANVDVLDPQTIDRPRLRQLGQKGRTIDERAVGQRAEKVVGEDLAETPRVARKHRRDVVIVQPAKRVEIVDCRRHNNGSIAIVTNTRGGRYQDLSAAEMIFTGP